MARRSPRSGAQPSPLRSIAVLGAVVVGALALAATALTYGTDAARSALGPVTVPEEYRTVVVEAAKRCPQVPAEVLAAQLAAESSWRTDAVSPVGAQGIAQFMPATWEQFGLDANGDGVADVWDPVDAIHSAAALNCVNRKLVRDVPGKRLENTLAAYNAGHGAVREHGGIPPFPETQDYVRKILETSREVDLG